MVLEELNPEVDKALEYLKASGNRVLLENMMDLLLCWSEGHPNQPKWFLRRFQYQPWRCKSCRTWWVTKAVRYEGDVYDWKWERVKPK